MRQTTGYEISAPVDKVVCINALGRAITPNSRFSPLARITPVPSVPYGSRKSLPGKKSEAIDKISSKEIFVCSVQFTKLYSTAVVSPFLPCILTAGALKVKHQRYCCPTMNDDMSCEWKA